MSEVTVHLLGYRYQPMCGFWRAPEGEVVRCTPHVHETTCKKCLSAQVDRTG